ncbi:uncharacterized protein LOC110988280 [Acanthaster planci]|uniref:Uncharacterized protein LOC110988280 n=1 Tax=Acanthaster planci TaxID=133434 RepID=A0A8B7ZR28_ACAPL|nr:uncharacterized protein LOC110988280 [Acanthaster planci]
MKCIRVNTPGEPLVFVNDEPIPKAPDDGAVVKIAYAGVCHTDVHVWEGGEGAKCLELLGCKYPVVPGHEIAGILFSVGESAAKNISASGLKLGDRVIVFPWIFCGECGPCKADHSVFCNGPISEVKSIGLSHNGGFEQYVAVPELRYVVPVPDSIPFPVASLLPCSGITGYHAVEVAVGLVKTITETKGGCSVLAIGAGGVGQWGIRLARAMYPPETQIICAEIKQEALDGVISSVRDTVPLLMGRDQPSDSIAQQVKAASRTGNGVNLVLDFVGVTKTFDVAMKSLQTKGQYVVTGLLGGEARFSLPDLVMTANGVKGVLVGSLTQQKRLVDLVVKMPSIYENLKYSVHPMEEGIQIMEKLARGEVVGRAILKCNDD